MFPERMMKKDGLEPGFLLQNLSDEFCTPFVCVFSLFLFAGHLLIQG